MSEIEVKKINNNTDVPKEARFVIYLYKETASTLQRTLLDGTDEIMNNKLERTWKDIREGDLSQRSYGVKFKNKEHEELPDTYVIRGVGEVKNYMDILDKEFSIEQDIEQANVSGAIEGTGVYTYIDLRLGSAGEIEDILAFDPRTMVLVSDDASMQMLENLQKEKQYAPITIPRDFGVLRRGEAYFVQQRTHEPNLHEQPFISRSGEQASIDFVAEYYNYCCNPIEYPGTEVRTIGYNDERFDITPEVLKYMEKKIGAQLGTLKVAKFFEKDGKNYRATHDLLCHMFLMNSWASVPVYLARGHLGDAEKATEQFNYYIDFLIHDNPQIIPNKAGAIELLKRIVTTIKNGPFARLMEVEIDVKDIMDLLGKGPYEDLVREQWRLVDNITEGDKIGFKLTPTGAMFLYMCCPNKQ